METERPTNQFEELVKQYNATPFHILLGLEIQSLEPGHSVLRLPLERNHMNYRGLTHGGVVATLCDSAMGMAIRTLGFRTVTVEMNLNYLDLSQEGQVLLAEGKILKAGRTLFVCEAEVRAGERLVAKSRGTFYLLPEDRSPPAPKGAPG